MQTIGFFDHISKVLNTTNEIIQCMSRVGYCNHINNVITFSLPQSDVIKWLPLYYTKLF
jgi:hypothetical protein